LLLLFHAEGAVIGRDHLEIIHLQAFPKLRLIRLFAQRRCHYVFGAVEVFAIVINGKEEILRAGLSKGGDAAIACLPNLVKGISPTEMNDVDRRLGHFGDRNGAMHALGFSHGGSRKGMIFRRGVSLRKRALNYFVDDYSVLSMHTD